MSLSSNFGSNLASTVPTASRVPLSLSSTGKLAVGWIPTMVGSNGTTGGTAGLVPTPAAADNVKFLRGDGTWVSAPVTSVNTRTGAIMLVGTDIPTFVASGGSHAAGAVPDPGSSAGTTKFLREDATWQIPAYPVTSVNTRTGAITLVRTDIPAFVGSGASHAPGAVPDPGSTAGSTRFLCEDGTWATPAGGGGGGGYGGSGTNSIQIGASASATATESIAIGKSASCTTAESVALGASSAAAATYSIAIGHSAATTSSDDGQIAIGASATVTAGNGGIAIGKTATLHGRGVAIGDGTTGADESIVIGKGSTAGENYDVVIGYGAAANGTGAPGRIVIGRGTADNQSLNAVVIGGGASATGGQYGVAIGNGAKTQQKGAIGIGFFAVAGAKWAIQLGVSSAYRAGTFVASGIPLQPNVFNAGADYAATPWQVAGTTAVIGSNYTDFKVNTVASRSSIILPLNTIMVLDDVTVLAFAATSVTGQPSIKMTGGKRTGTTAAVLASASAGTSVNVNVVDSTGFSVGDWALAEQFVGSELTREPLGMMKVTVVPDSSHITFDRVPESLTTSTTITKLTATDNNVLASTATTGLTAPMARWTTTAMDNNGWECFVFEVGTAATGTTLNGRAFLRGLVIETAFRFTYT